MRKCKNYKTKKSRITAFFMAFTLVLTTCFCSIPQTVFAETRGPESFVELTSSSSRTLSSGFYCVKKNLTFNPKDGCKNGLQIAADSTVFIYVVDGVTLTVKGRDANEMEGAGAGIYVPKGATVVFLGEGTVRSYGGAGADGGAAENGEDSTISGGMVTLGAGGAGGYGGGGAGAGIGTDGGDGNVGGAGGAGYSVNYEQGGTGKDGSNGEDGNAAAAAGAVYAMYSVTVKATGGDAGISGGNGACGANGSEKIDNITRVAVGGAGGGGGGGGEAGAAIGTGGGGAGGGGGGASSGYVNCGMYIGGGGGGGGDSQNPGDGGTKSKTQTYNLESGIVCSRTITAYSSNGDQPDGGSGGAGYATLSGATKTVGAGGTGGDGGASGGTKKNVSKKEAVPDNYVPYYTTTFEGADSDEVQIYYMSWGTQIYVPEYTAPKGQTFLGWQVKKGMTSLVETDAKNFVEGDTNYYQAGDSVIPLLAAYGDIVLTPVCQEATSNSSTWKMTETDSGATLLSEEDYGVQNEIPTAEGSTVSASDNWELLSQSVDGEGKVARAVLRNSGNVDVTVSMQDKSSVEGVNVQCYQIFRIDDIYTDKDTGEPKYVFELQDEAYRTFFKDYFKMTDAMPKDSAIVNQILALNNDELMTMASKLKYFIKENNIEPIAEQTGADGEMSMTMDVSRQYVYENGAGSYTGGLGYYFISRDDAIDNTYTMQTFDVQHNFVELKGSGLVIKKTGNQVLMKYGDTVTYQITSKVMNTGGDGNYIYCIYDWMEPTLTMVANSLKLTVTDTNGTITLVSGTDYSVETIKEIPEGQTSEQDVLKVTLLWTSQLKDDSHVGDKLVVEYQAKLNEDATSGIAAGNENFNRAWITCGTTDKLNKTEIQEWNVYTMALTLHKQNEIKKNLAGAKFTLYDIADTDHTNPLLFTKAANGVYYYDASGSEELETDEEGNFEIRGLDGSSYILVETSAPRGYLPIDPVTLSVSTNPNVDKDTLTQIRAQLTGSKLAQLQTDADNGYLNLTITDPKEGVDDLPATGGKGRTLVYVGGILLLIISFTAFIIRRKTEDDEEE
ncbi:MAG: isopeptide-forming domain-containing fimbrial protein [Lachnospiraceae bacterium]